MTDNFPLLTYENVYNWYWKELKSGHDIAKIIGCHYQTVYNFMDRTGILKRDYSKSGLLRFQDPQKYNDFINSRNTEEWSEKQSESHKLAWSDPKKCEEVSDYMKSIMNKRLFGYQKIILLILSEKRNLTVSDLEKCSSLTKKQLYNSLKILRRRQLISLLKSKNISEFNITEKGKKLFEEFLLNNSISKTSIKEDLEQLVNNYKALYTNNFKKRNTKISKFQQKVLDYITAKGPCFVKQIQIGVNYQSKDISKTLKRLVDRNLLGRNIGYNKKSSRRKKTQYLYFIQNT